MEKQKKVKLKVLGSSSAGNCYILTTSQGKHLLLDAGLPIQEIKIGLDFDIGNLEGCIVTHHHADHAKSAHKLESMGIRVFRPYEIDKAILKTQIGDFAITSFPVPHNGTECRGFLIEADEKKILYITDAEYCEYRFHGIDAIMIECNYDKRIIDESLPNYAHSCLGHMELQTCIGFINICCDDDKPQNIILIHMSKRNLNKENAFEEIKRNVNTDANVIFAEAGMEIEI